MNVGAWDDLGAVQARTLVVRGAESNILSAATANRMLETLRDGNLVEVSKAGHLVQGDNPVEFDKVVREFLQLPTA